MGLFHILDAPALAIHPGAPLGALSLAFNLKKLLDRGIITPQEFNS
jgi:hypothetical protein